MNCCDKCGNCSRCGECCAATLPITENEEKKIREYIKANNIEPEFFQKGNDINLQCCFYDRKNKICNAELTSVINPNWCWNKKKH